MNIVKEGMCWTLYADSKVEELLLNEMIPKLQSTIETGIASAKLLTVGMKRRYISFDDGIPTIELYRDENTKQTEIKQKTK